MKCVIPGANVKILARAVHALGKIGDELYVQPHERALSFRSVSMSNSAYCDFSFRDNYFSYYDYGDLEEEDALKCKVSMRAAMSVFKTPGTIDKLVETCHIKLKPSASKLIFILKYKNSVIKTFLLPILNCEALQAAYNKDGVPNILVVQPKVLLDALQNFQQNLIEITLDVSKDKILMRNYVNDTSGAGNATRTQLALTIDEFSTYKIGQETCVTFCMKEVRAMLAFADIVGIPLHLLFELAGRPIVFVLRNPSFEANLVLSTLNPEPLNVPNTTIQDRRQALKKRNALKRGAGTLPKTRAKSKKSGPTIQNITDNTRHSARRKVQNDTNNSTCNVQISKEMTANTLVPLVRATSINKEDAEINGPQIDQQPAFAPARPSSKTSTNFVAETPSSGSTLRVHTFSSFSESSMFSSSTSRYRIDEIANNHTHSDIDDDDVVPNSPPPIISPSKRARIMFKKCFQATFDPRMLPGHDEILVKNSDSE